jgi:hypothetical protein
MIMLVTGTGRTIVCTTDHPILTSNGWMRASKAIDACIFPTNINEKLFTKQAILAGIVGYMCFSAEVSDSNIITLFFYSIQDCQEFETDLNFLYKSEENSPILGEYVSVDENIHFVTTPEFSHTLLELFWDLTWIEESEVHVRNSFLAGIQGGYNYRQSSLPKTMFVGLIPYQDNYDEESKSVHKPKASNKKHYKMGESRVEKITNTIISLYKQAEISCEISEIGLQSGKIFIVFPEHISDKTKMLELGFKYRNIRYSKCSMEVERRWRLLGVCKLDRDWETR